MKRHLTIACAAAFSGLLGVATLAATSDSFANDPRYQGTKEGMEQELRDGQTQAHFERLDRNGDGRISQAELEADDASYLDADATGHRITMSGLDANSDGVISLEEWNSKYYDMHGSRYDERYRSSQKNQNQPNRLDPQNR